MKEELFHQQSKPAITLCGLFVINLNLVSNELMGDIYTINKNIKLTFRALAFRQNKKVTFFEFVSR